MFLCDEVNVPVGVFNARHYEELGYKIPKISSNSNPKHMIIPRGSTISVKIKDLPRGSNVIVQCRCDYCGDVFERMYCEIFSTRENNVEKDSCGKPECKKAKMKDTLMFRYGTTNKTEIHKKTGTHLGRFLKYDLQYYIDAFAELDKDICVGLIEDKEHVLAETRLPFICRNHPEAGVQYSSYINSSAKNRKCCAVGGRESINTFRRIADISDAKQICEKRNYTLLTETIRSVDDKIEYICNKHPEYGVQTTTLYGMKKYDCNCRLCSAKKSNKENHWNWHGGINDVNDTIRKSWEYKQWRQEVYKRDNFTCRRCGDSKIALNAHHILNFSNHEELRFDISNGITLCEDCHREFHNAYGNRNNTMEQLDEFLATETEKA